MRTRLMQKTAGFLVLASLTSGICLVSATTSVQAATVTSKTTYMDGRKSTDNAVTTRSTSAKPETVATSTTSKPQQQHDKKTIGRCWKRIMTMVREVRHAHRNAHN